MRRIITTALDLLGASLIVAGTAVLLSVGVALIVAGTLILVASRVAADSRPSAPGP